MTGFRLFASVFGVVFLAELPDKTALAALFLATRYPAFAVFVGASLALTVQSLVAVGAGHLVSLLPERPVHVGAGLLFLVSAVLMWRRRDDDDRADEKKDDRAGFFHAATKVFGVVFVAEWGDLTQLATAAMAARYAAPVTVFAGATAALWSVTAIAVVVGHHAKKMLDPDVTKKIAAVAFAAVGVALVAGWL